ncbi:MAG: hypothetical protein RLW61_08420 [Gammaproteobacteria bacterium]
MSEMPAWPAQLAVPGAVRDGAQLVAFGDRTAERELAGCAATHAPRGDLAVVSVGGADARQFLHAQVSANLAQLGAGAGVCTAWCSPKGRVLYLLTVIGTDDGFRVLLPRARCEAFVKRLRMFVLRAAVTVEPLPDDGVVILDGVTAPLQLPAGLMAGEVTGTTLVCGPADILAESWNALPGTPIGEPAALLADVRRARPRLDDALVDQFLPQELDLDRHAGVSFDKGCYPGQEIIARVRFRGSVKRRLARFAATGDALPAPGTRLVVSGSDRACGTVLMAAPATHDRTELLAVLDVGATGVALATHPQQLLERLDDGDGGAD